MPSRVTLRVDRVTDQKGLPRLYEVAGLDAGEIATKQTRAPLNIFLREIVVLP